MSRGELVLPLISLLLLLLLLLLADN